MACCWRADRAVVLLALCLPVLVSVDAAAVSITTFNPSQTSSLTPGPPLPGVPGAAAYRFNLADSFPGSRNALPIGEGN